MIYFLMSFKKKLLNNIKLNEMKTKIERMFSLTWGSLLIVLALIFGIGQWMNPFTTTLNTIGQRVLILSVAVFAIATGLLLIKEGIKKPE